MPNFSISMIEVCKKSHVLLADVRGVFFIGQAVLTCTHNQCFEQIYSKYQNLSDEKNISILHGRIFVMCSVCKCNYIKDN